MMGYSTESAWIELRRRQDCMKNLTNALILLLFVGFTATAGAAYLHGTVTMEVDLSAHGPMEEARLWLPYPMSDKYQLITNIKVSGDFSEAAVYSDRVFETPMLFARWDKDAKRR